MLIRNFTLAHLVPRAAFLAGGTTMAVLFILFGTGLMPTNSAVQNISRAPAVIAEPATPRPLAARPTARIVTPASHVSQTIAACSPAPAFPATAPLSLSVTQPGLHIIVDPPAWYVVHGLSGPQIRQQIERCSPVEHGAFSSLTNATVNWTYSYTQTNNQCSITTAAVGVHVSQIFPLWQQPDATSSLKNQWNSFMSDLQEHENGHAQLAWQYGQQLYGQLQSLSAPTCQDLSAQANKITGGAIMALQRANSDYDTQTSHGATQGAILP